MQAPLFYKSSESRQPAPLPLGASLRMGKPRSPLQSEPRKNNFHPALVWRHGTACNAPLELSTEETRANLYPWPDARDTPAPYVHHRALQNLLLETKGRAAELIFATGRKSSHLEEGARRCHFFKRLQDKGRTPIPQGPRSRFPPKDDAQEDSVRPVKPDVLNRTGLKPVYTHEGNTSLADRSSGKR